MSEILEIELDENDRIRLPKDVIALLGGARTLFLRAHADASEIVLSALPPVVSENVKILDELADLNRGVADDGYFAPVPDSFLGR